MEKGVKLLMVEDFKDDDRMGKCYKCGEAITGKQYRNGNYKCDWTTNIDEHRRCPNGARGRALEKTMEAIKEKEYNEMINDLKKKFRFIVGHRFKSKRRRPNVGEIIDEGQEWVTDSIEELHFIMVVNDPIEIRKEILKFCQRYIHYDELINQQVSNVWVSWQGITYEIERKYDIKTWKLLRGWNVVALLKNNRYTYCPMEKFIHEPEFD